jgi:selenophosphate synthase
MDSLDDAGVYKLTDELAIIQTIDFFTPIVDDPELARYPSNMQDILFDPQTSGGLLICIEPGKAELLLNRLQQNGVGDAVIIGETLSEPEGVL